MFLSPGSRARPRSKVSPSFPTGTLMVFQQSTAPTGWTKQTSFNDTLMRIVSGTASSGGTNGFVATFNAQTTVGNHTLTTAELASHTHSFTATITNQNVNLNCVTGAAGAPVAAGTTGSQGSGTAHNHTITTSILYVDFIIARKN